MTERMNDVRADLARRVLHGAACHMSTVQCGWREFVTTLGRKMDQSLSEGGVALAVEILR